MWASPAGDFIMDTEHYDWVFGYGSLMWRPAFSFEYSRPGYIRGFERRFWQGSVDHRGTPDAPGRVVTLVRKADALCWGTAFKIRREDKEQIYAALDLRESGGYSRETVKVVFSDGSSSAALMYRATPANVNYLGPAPLDAVAAQVCDAFGPSGANTDYVLELAEALREMQVYDDEVHALEAHLRRLIMRS